MKSQCLSNSPTTDDDKTYISFVGDKCKLSGWGGDRNPSARHAAALQVVRQPENGLGGSETWTNEVRTGKSHSTGNSVFKTFVLFPLSFSFHVSIIFYNLETVSLPPMANTLRLLVSSQWKFTSHKQRAPQSQFVPSISHKKNVLQFSKNKPHYLRDVTSWITWTTEVCRRKSDF
jgi:hypothetical protein